MNRIVFYSILYDLSFIPYFRNPTDKSHKNKDKILL